MSRTSKAYEDYLETILILEKTRGIVRSIDIAESKRVSRPSVNKAINNLISLGYVIKENYGHVYLTDTGREKATEIMNKHNLITNFLIEILKVSPEISENDACQMEHFLSNETLEKLENFLIKYSLNKSNN
ncbi:MAG: metal-dependent transcriptional regulator [Clostridium sp.]